jgi:D-glycero-alpha-D-manno-heptose 1-phosphate guanylyltransferase
MDLSHIDAIILCGGLGKRLRSVIGETQKVMAKTGDRPFLDVILGNLKKQGLRRVILCTGFDARRVEDYYAASPQGLEIVFSKESKPLGTGGAIKQAQAYVKSDHAFVMNGDCYCDLDLKAMLQSHLHQSALVTLSVSPLEDKKDYGGVSVAPDGQVVAFKEKESSSANRFASVGLYCFRRDAWRAMPATDAFSLEYDFFPLLTGRGLYAFIVDKPFYDIGTPDRFGAAQQRFKARRAGIINRNSKEGI